ncbi:MAG: Crp/Fnr family transcriptional regulator [Pseudomonadota bacterium]
MYLDSALCAGSVTSPANPCGGCSARAKSICAELSDPMVVAMFRLGRTEFLRRGETLMWESDEAIVVGTVREGMLKLTASLDDGREQILGVAFPGDFVGRPFGARAGHCVTALVDTRLCVFRRSAFDGFAREHPEIEHALLVRTLDELDRARRWMLLLGRKTAQERVATLLLEISERLGHIPGERVELGLTRQQMGDLLGLTIETVSRKITQLKSSGAIKLPDLRSYVVADEDALRSFAGS